MAFWVLEVNGKLVLAKTKEDMLRLLAVAPDPAQLVVLRTSASGPNTLTSHSQGLELRSALERAQEAEHVREALKTDNVRLTHRISYLEEQVSELLEKVKDTSSFLKIGADPDTASLYSSSPTSSRNVQASPANATPTKPDVQVFQKGPQVTAIVANLPGLDVGSNSPAESRHMLPTLRSKTSSQSSAKNHDARSTKSLDVGSNCSSMDIAQHHRHHHHNSYRKHEKHTSHHGLQNAQSTNSLDACNKEMHARLNSRSRYHSQFYLSEKVVKTAHSVSDYASEASSSIDTRHYHHKKYSDSLRRKSEYHFISEMKNGRSNVDYTSESSASTFHRAHRDVRSIKSLDIESDSGRNMQRHYTSEGWPYSVHSQNRIVESKSSTTLDDASETSSTLSHQHKHKSEVHDGKPQRPKPPKKPLRLSLSRTTSLQVMNTSPPATPVNGSRKPTKRTHNGESPPALGQADVPARTPSRAGSCQPAMRWSSPASQLHHVKSSASMNGFAANEKCTSLAGVMPHVVCFMLVVKTHHILRRFPLVCSTCTVHVQLSENTSMPCNQVPDAHSAREFGGVP
ncbi:hypothetical protein PR048_009258 [Dryococelus australis]|uniref:PDZ domain-containing protein n=1 Tax=Dryococelus australis TaxID=614101 RepID=A0ABQ9HZE4_9NEOP|nr:hypothetical protein PR048_009258 [Dryococelus australis]